MPQQTSLQNHPTLSFPTVADMESFLEVSHSTSSGFYLKLAKKNSGIPSISAAEAVEVALCFGWIDGRANALDSNYWTVRYTPRRPKSIWSQKNVATVGKLIEQGKMRPAGLAAVEAAKDDGRWERAYAGPATITVPNDLTAALEKELQAKVFFGRLNKSERYAVLHKVATASPKNRANRIKALVKQLVEGKSTGGSVEKLKKTANAKKAASKTVPAKRRASSLEEIKDTAPSEDSQVPQPRREGLRRRQ
ncbi:hypothetical protein GQ43DRAFT_428241 [Delitschia confertaspora ATCC 74209]|uniref:Bacteriocin-protection protein, YdeI/OmpD-associated family n=1 Tax=Delitschia confertaspora ATCC 74209 TaxID=1513339 RepID=A0A9P4JZ97_9PLEO|nr:hypothetical protein GQ43DRAFT_428241 [Delitschia confertaspora ATCC 74209]